MKLLVTRCCGFIGSNFVNFYFTPFYISNADFYVNYFYIKIYKNIL